MFMLSISWRAAIRVYSSMKIVKEVPGSSRSLSMLQCCHGKQQSYYLE
jgi:hypothetical protein